jgi:hypothetical protein
MEHFGLQRGKDCAALAFSNVALACGFFYFLKKDKYEEFYDLGNSQTCRKHYTQNIMTTIENFFRGEFFERFAVDQVTRGPQKKHVGETLGAYTVKDLVDQLSKEQTPQILGIYIRTKSGKDFAHRVAYVPDDEGNYHIIDQNIFALNYDTEKTAREYEMIDRIRGIGKSDIIWFRFTKKTDKSEDLEMSFFDYSRKYGTETDMKRFVDLRQRLMDRIKALPETPKMNKIMQDTVDLNIRSVKRIIGTLMEKGDLDLRKGEDIELRQLLNMLKRTEKIPDHLGKTVPDNPRSMLIPAVKSAVVNYIEKLKEKDPMPGTVKYRRMELLSKLQDYVDVAEMTPIEFNLDEEPSKRRRLLDDEAGPSKPKPPRARGERQPRPYKRGQYTLIDDEPFTSGQYTLIDDDPDELGGGVNRRVKPLDMIIDELRKHSKRYYNKLVREGMPTREARERTASHIFMVRHYMSRGYNLRQAHELALRSEEFADFTGRTRQRLAQIMDSDSDGGSVQRLYGPVGGMAFTRQSGGTCVPSAYKHMFVMKDEYRPYLKPEFDSVADCFPFDGKLVTTDKYKVFKEHYNRFISKMVNIPKRNFLYHRFDDKEDLKIPGRQHLFKPDLKWAEDITTHLANKVRDKGLIVPENTGIVFMLSDDSKSSHALAYVDGRYIDANQPQNPDPLTDFKNKRWKLQAITVVGVDGLRTEVVPEAQAAKERIDQGIVIQEYPHFKDYDTLPHEEKKKKLFARQILADISHYYPEVAVLPNAEELRSKMVSDWKELRKKLKRDFNDEFSRDFAKITTAQHMRDFWAKYPAPPDPNMPALSEGGMVYTN